MTNRKNGHELVWAAWGDRDTTGLPDPLILTYSFTLVGDQIAMSFPRPGGHRT
jgi:hypothetical protein